MRNRYRNAVWFTDKLVGQVLNDLEASGVFEKMVVLLTGDHGEEFMEHGHMYHANDLCNVQTEVPFLLHLPQNLMTSNFSERERVVASHVAFLPTLIDALGKERLDSWDGESLFSKEPGAAMVVAQNGDMDPIQFTLVSRDYRAAFTFRSAPIRFENSIFLKSLSDENGHPLPLSAKSARKIVIDSFANELYKLFPNLEVQ